MDASLTDAMRTQFGGSKGPDGRLYVTVTHQVGNCSFAYAIPLDQAETIAHAFKDNVLDAAAKLRREASGLAVANTADVPMTREQRRAIIKAASRHR